MSRSWPLVLASLLLTSCLQGQDQKPPPAPKGDIARLIRQLGSESFALRESASKRLEERGADALEPLRQAATEADDAEVRSRAQEVAERICQGLFGQERQFDGHEQQVNALAISADGKRLLSAGQDATV